MIWLCKHYLLLLAVAKTHLYRALWKSRTSLCLLTWPSSAKCFSACCSFPRPSWNSFLASAKSRARACSLQGSSSSLGRPGMLNLSLSNSSGCRA